MDTSTTIDPRIRAAFAAAAEARGLPEMARETRTTVSEARAFLQGAEPSARARRRLEVWFRLWPSPRELELRDVALTLISRIFPEQQREGTRRRFLTLLYREGARMEP